MSKLREFGVGRLKHPGVIADRGGGPVGCNVLAFTKEFRPWLCQRRPMSLYYTKHRRESMTGTTLVKKFSSKTQASSLQGCCSPTFLKLSTHKNNPGLGMGVISFLIVNHRDGRLFCSHLSPFPSSPQITATTVSFTSIRRKV